MITRLVFYQKSLLILLGFIVFVVLLEAGLWLAGFTLTSLQANRNRRSLGKEGGYRILCLGESTTQGQYPPFLEARLNENGRHLKFVVFDEGKAGTKTTDILSHVEAYLDEYHPDMVVSMMGVNDGAAPHLPHENPSPSGSTRLLESVHTYKLARLLWLHLTARANVADMGIASPEPSQVQDSQPSFPNAPRQGQFGQAEAVLRRAAALDPRNDRAYLALETFYQQQGAFALAEVNFGKVIELNPKNEHAYIELGHVYERQLKFPQAEASLRKALELNPRSDEAYLVLGDVSYEQGRLMQAEDSFLKVVDLDPRNDQAYLDLGNVYKQQGQLARAEDSVIKALELNPGNVWACLELEDVYKQQGQLAHAKASLEKARARNPRSEWTYLVLGSVYKQQGQLTLAEADLKKALALNPKNEQAHLELAQTHLALEQAQFELARPDREQGRLAEAAAHYKKALALNPKSTAAYVELGNIYMQQGQLNLAERWYRKGLEFSDSHTSAQIYGELAVINEKLAHTAQANKFFDQADRLAAANRSNNDPSTARNYLALKAILDKRKIRLISVQYPMRPLASLKKIFPGEAGDIIFVDNEKIFRDAVGQDGLNAYFRDIFGGDFGHCTERGNRLLGENIAKVMLRELFGTM